VPLSCPPGLPRHLTHDLAALHVFSHLLSFGPSPSVFSHVGFRLGLLRPLLTSRSSFRCRPFRHRARSPQVRTHTFIAQPPHLRRFALVTRALRFLARSPCLAAPSMRFLFIGSQFMLCASFPHSVTLMQLRLRFARCDQLAAGLAPAGVRPCWAHKSKKPSQDGFFV